MRMLVDIQSHEKSNRTMLEKLWKFLYAQYYGGDLSQWHEFQPRRPVRTLSGTYSRDVWRRRNPSGEWVYKDMTYKEALDSAQRDAW